MPQQCSLAFFPGLSFASVSPRPKVSLPQQSRMSFAGFQKDEEEEAVPGRARSCRINVAFAILRTLIPTEPADRKLSKIETLRLACSYISHLGALLVSGSCDKARQSNESGRKRAQVCTFCVASTKRSHFERGP